MNIKDELEKTRAEMIDAINMYFDMLLVRLGGDVSDLRQSVPLTVKPHCFIGKKPLAVAIGEETVPVKTWVGVYSLILSRCLRDDRCRERLMDLRGKVSGRARVFISHCPDDMTHPIRIEDGFYAESHYGSETMMHILVERILKPTGFDVSDISIVVGHPA